MKNRRLYLFLLLVVGIGQVVYLNGCQTRDARFSQYYVQGEQLYVRYCSNCHQKDGSGLGLLYPPVNQSDFVDQRFSEVVCSMRNGLRGSMLVNGKEYNQPMPGIPYLTDLEVAEITTYLYNTWGRNRGLVPLEEVQQVLADCAP